MKSIKIYSSLCAVLIAAMSIGFTSCNNDNKEPDPDLLVALLKKWIDNSDPEHNSRSHYFVFNKDNTYTYATLNKTINGIYRITEIKETPYTFDNGDTYNATLYKMLASGSADYDQLHIYYLHGTSIYVHFFSGNELVQKLFFWKADL